MNLIEAIRVFRRVSETKSFSLVAKELGVTQPTVSKTIQALEAELGLVLFRRSTRGLSLTDEGRTLYAAGGGLIDHFETVLADVKGERLSLTGEVRISASLAFARLVLVPQLPELGKLHPELKPSFVLHDGYVDLIEQNVDVAIRIGRLADSTLKATKLGVSHRAPYAAKSYLKRHGRPKTLADLAKHRLLFYTRHDERAHWPLVDANGRQTTFSFTPYLKTDGSDLMREAVLEGLGLALLPTWMMAGPERDATVERVLPELTFASAEVSAVTPPARELTAKQRALIQFLRARFADVPSLA